MRYKLFAVIVFLFVFAGGAFAQEAKKDGWWIKANPQNQETGMMAFYVGTTGSSYTFWRVWSPGDPTDFDVPAEFRNGPTLFLLAQTTSGLKGRLCMMHKTRGVKYIEFDLEESYEAKQSEEDSKCK